MIDLRPVCENCGAVYAGREAHQGFHDTIMMLYQQVTGLTDEEFQRHTGQSAAERDTRILARAEKLAARAREETGREPAQEARDPHPA